MNRHELARLGQYFKDTGREGCGHGVAADASNNVLEGIGAVILKFAAAPDNLPKAAIPITNDMVTRALQGFDTGTGDPNDYRRRMQAALEAALNPSP